MRIADKIFTSLLQRQAAPRETGDKPSADTVASGSGKTPQGKAKTEAETSGERALETLSHPAARTLDALIRDRVLSLTRDPFETPTFAQEDPSISQLAAAFSEAPRAERTALLDALAEREEALVKAANQNANLFSQEFRDFLD